MAEAIGKIKEEVLEKYKCWENKGRGEPPKWRMVQRVKKYHLRKWGDDCWERIFSWFREYELQRKQGMQESQTEKEEIRQQQRMTVMTDVTSKIKRQDGHEQQDAKQLARCEEKRKE